MTEAEAQQWLRMRFGVSPETKLADFVAIVRDEAREQNLVSRTSLEVIWTRHILDSAQLLSFASPEGRWVDIGTGAGFPGLVIAILRGDAETILIEPRRRRAEFLALAASRLGLNNTAILTKKAEETRGRASVISARAVASIDRIFAVASGWANKDTTWILPRGRSGADELAEARKSWHGEFHVEQSLTSAESVIVRASGVRRR